MVKKNKQTNKKKQCGIAATGMKNRPVKIEQRAHNTQHTCKEYLIMIVNIEV